MLCKHFRSNNLSKYETGETRIKFDFPRSFISKLYNMTEKYHKLDAGILYLPDFVYHYSRFDSSLRKKIKPIFETYNRYDLDKNGNNPIYYLPIILNWRTRPLLLITLV